MGNGGDRDRVVRHEMGGLEVVWETGGDVSSDGRVCREHPRRNRFALVSHLLPHLVQPLVETSDGSAARWM